MNLHAAGKHAAFVELLRRYHGTLNLLSANGLDEIDRLVDDAVEYARVVEELAGEKATVVDVGSGAGLPAMIMAASLPEANFKLVERRRRRGAFLELASSRLGLDNVSVVKGDVLRLRGVCADVITAQAVAEFAEVARLTRHLHGDPCFVVSRRGPRWLEEVPAVAEFLSAEAWPPSRRADEFKGAAENAPSVAVAVERRLEHRGSLVALRLTGGPACRSSGS